MARQCWNMIPRRETLFGSITGTAESPFRSDLRSRQQLLPGGNVLITEADGGRLLEVTRSGEVVWEYMNPIRGGEDEELIPVVCGGRRYSAKELPFLDKADSKPTTVATTY